MKRLTVLISATIMLTIASCHKEEIADLIIINGKVLTIDASNPLTEALAIRGEMIIAVGKTREISRYSSDGFTKIIDASGRLVIPGFNDAHAHFGPLDPDYIELRYITDPSVLTEKVRLQVERSEPGELIRGGHWDHEMFNDRQWPAKDMIDKVSPDNPVILSRIDGHSVLVNSYVLRKSGITGNTPDPPGGEIMKDPVTNEPTGILKERAKGLIRAEKLITSLTPGEQQEKTWQGYILALKEAAEYGVTSIQVPGFADFSAYEKLREQGLLTSRIDIGQALSGDSSKLESYIELSKRYPRDSNWIRFSYLKCFIDGTLGSGTALMFEPFDDRPETSGLEMIPYEKFEKMVIIADRMGFQIGVHAIGDKGNNRTLNAYEKALMDNGKRDSRHRIEHAQVLRISDIPRFSELGVLPSMQPTHCISDKRFCEKRIGTERSGGAYAWKSLLNSGATLALGTDYQVEPLNPMEGLYAAVTRKDRHGETGEGWMPGEKLTMEEAIKYYTWGSACSQFMENRKGMIRKGYLADIVITDKDLLTIPESEIMKTRVDYTITGGKVVYQSGR